MPLISWQRAYAIWPKWKANCEKQRRLPDLDHFDLLRDNFQSICRLSAGWNGKMQCIRSFLRVVQATWSSSPFQVQQNVYTANKKAKAYLAPVWSRSLSGSRCLSPPETYVHGSSGMSHLWHKLWSCPGCCPGPPGGLCPPWEWEWEWGEFRV